MPDGIKLRIGNMAKAVLVTGQAYQDPKDALNEFVSNAADEYAQAGMRGRRIRIVLRRRGRHPVIAVEDVGRGMDVDRLRDVARNLFNSAKAGSDADPGAPAPAQAVGSSTPASGAALAASGRGGGSARGSRAAEAGREDDVGAR